MDKKLYNILHVLYKTIGHIICRILMMYWEIRDSLCPPKENAVLFVAHPDDDTLFFHQFIKEYHPYVVLMTTGWSLRRLPDFFKTMKHYGVRYRAFDMETNDTRINTLNQRVAHILKLGNFEIIATHNSSGEYGHLMHVKVHDAVAKSATSSIFTPVSSHDIKNFPIENSLIDEKIFIFNNYYRSEIFVLDQYKDWVKHEKLIQND